MGYDEQFSEPEFEFEQEPTDEELESLEKALADPGTIAFLDQQEAEFDSGRAKWAALHGFDHECHCSQDYTDGAIGSVTRCFMQLTSQALARCVEATHEIRVFSSMVDELLTMQNDLVKMMENFGHEKELQEYFGETLEIEDDVLSQMELQFTDEDELGLEDEGEGKLDAGDDKS